MVVGAASGVVISVDGAWGAPGLNLSHWPGNATPADLRHDLSTGSALRFARLDDTERARRSAGATAIANNHYDTDGAMALFAVRHPRAALAHADALLEAAETGDFYRLPSERGLVLDALVGGLVDPARSPIAADLAGCTDGERYDVATAHLLEHLPSILDGGTEPYRALWEPVLERARLDRDALAGAGRDERPRADLAVWRSRVSWPATGPGRHALFGSTERDRVLALAPDTGGHTFRLIVSTRSWFDLDGNAHLREAGRPDLARLAAELNALEGCTPADDVAWRAQDPAGASPELWFGTAELDRFAEHSDALRPSALDPDRVQATVERALAARGRSGAYSPPR